MHVVFHLPFIGISDTETQDNMEYLTCEFCPNTKMIYYNQAKEGYRQFSNTKVSVLKHALSQQHKANVLKYNETVREMCTLDKDRKAAMAVFRSVNGGLKQGYYFVQIIRELTVLHYHGVSVGNINHSKDTLKTIKDTISGVLRSKVKKVLSAPLPCTLAHVIQCQYQSYLIK